MQHTRGSSGPFPNGQGKRISIVRWLLRPFENLRKLNYVQIERHEASRNDFEDTVYGRPEYFDELAAKVTSDAPVFEKRPLVWALRAFEEKWRRIYIKALRPLSWGARLLYARMWRACNEGSLEYFEKAIISSKNVRLWTLSPEESFNSSECRRWPLKISEMMSVRNVASLHV